MRIIYHPSSRFDVLDIVEYYEREGDAMLADEFYQELLITINKIRSRPNSYPIFFESLRRVNLRRFPHHILYEILDDKTIGILVVKHGHRDPKYGLDRRM